MTDAGIVPVWVIDDEPRNQRQVGETFRTLGHARLLIVPFLDGRLAIAEFEALLARNDASVPRIVFMDFYLGATRGDAVTRRFREIYGSALAAGFGGPAPVIVAHSSTSSGSAEIMRAGADFVIPKDPGASVSIGILNAFASADDVERILASRAV